VMGYARTLSSHVSCLDRERAPAHARGQGVWATAAGCGLRAAHSPVIEYPAPSRRPIVVHVRNGDAGK